jgi:hypothetical protein
LEHNLALAIVDGSISVFTHVSSAGNMRTNRHSYGQRLGAVIKKKYSMKVVYPIATLLLIANTINIGADIDAMSASIRHHE